MRDVVAGMALGAVLLSACATGTSNRAAVATSTAPAGAGLPSELQDDYRRVAARDAIRPIYEPQFVTSQQAELQAGELVMGVEVGGVSKAYPVGVLEFREMVNDQVASTPVVVTWCPLCRSGAVFDRRVDRATLTFGNQTLRRGRRHSWGTRRWC
ncbi:MAG: DUF3179 domain-containing (seleno)protein [Nitriliruptorales bacterium]